MAVIPLRPRRGQGSDPPVVRPRASRSLTDTEAMRLRAAVRNLRGLYGSLRCLAEVMGVSPKTLGNFLYGMTGGSPGLALRAAKAAGTPVEQLLGGLASVGRCPHCGATWEAAP